MRPFRLLLPSLLAVAWSPTHLRAQDDPCTTSYAGFGFVQVLPDHPPSTYSADAVVVGDLGEMSLPDLAMLFTDAGGATEVVVNFDAAERGRYETVTTGVMAIEVVTHATGDVLYSTDGTELHRHDWNGAGFVTSLVGSGLGGCELRAVRTDDGDPGLAVIRTNRSLIRLLEYESGAWVQKATISPQGSQGTFFGVERLDFDVDGVLDSAVISQAGLHVQDASGASLGWLDLDFDTGRIAAVPSARAVAGRDLLVVHGTIGSDVETLVWHGGIVDTPAEYVVGQSAPAGRILLADFLGNDGWPDVVLSMEGTEQLFLLQQDPAAASPHFAVPTLQPCRVGLADIDLRAGCSLSGPAVPVGAADMDEDGSPGDVDLVVVTSCNELAFVTQEALGMESRPAVSNEPAPQIVGSGSSRELRWLIDVGVPEGTDQLEVVVYREATETSGAAHLYTRPVEQVQTSPHHLNLVAPAPFASNSEVYQIEIRAKAGGASFPTQTRYWSDDGTVMTTLRGENNKVYPWYGPGGGGGTVQRPRIDPIVN